MRAYLAILISNLTLFALFSYPFCNYYEARYQSEFLLSGSAIVKFSREFLSIFDKKQPLSHDETSHQIKLMLVRLDEVLNKGITAEAVAKNSASEVANLSAGKEPQIIKAKPEVQNTARQSQLSTTFLNLQAGDSVLLIGDSIMRSFGGAFESDFAKRGILLQNIAKSSTGLVNKEFYNWQEVLKSSLAKQKPSLIIAHFGANDAYGIYENKKLLKFGSKEWGEFYLKRVQEIYDIAEENMVHVAWLEVPCMRKKSFDDKMEFLNQLYKSAAIKNSSLFVHTKEPICDDGEYMKFKTVNGRKILLRADDGVHFSVAGAKEAVDFINKELKSASHNADIFKERR